MDTNIFCGVVKIYYDLEKTRLKEEYFMNNNKIEGIKKIYHETGELCVEVNYIDDKENGIYKAYHQTGRLCMELNYIDDTKKWVAY